MNARYCRHCTCCLARLSVYTFFWYCRHRNLPATKISGRHLSLAELLPAISSDRASLRIFEKPFLLTPDEKQQFSTQPGNEIFGVYYVRNSIVAGSVKKKLSRSQCNPNGSQRKRQKICVSLWSDVILRIYYEMLAKNANLAKRHGVEMSLLTKKWWRQDSKKVLK